MSTREPDLQGIESEGLEIVSELSRTPRGRVLRVRRRAEPRDAVLRVGARAHPGIESELALFARVASPALVAPVAWGRTADGRSWLLRPYVEGRPFDVAIEDPSVPVAQAVAWTRELLQALVALHEAGFVHRDIKASNVLVADRGVVLVDLDLVGSGAADTEAAGGSTGRAPAGDSAGSPLHVAPEVLLGQPNTPRADLFSVGALLAFAFCGAPAAGFLRQFPARPFWQAAELDPARLPDELAPLVRALVHRHPDDRPASARAALALLGEEAAPSPSQERTLPLLVGREKALNDLLAPLLRAAEPGSVLVTVRDAEELRELADQAQLALALAGTRAARHDSAALPAVEEEAAAEPVMRRTPEQLVARLRASGAPAVVLVLSAPEADDAGRAADVETALALLLAATQRGPCVLVLAPPRTAQDLTAALGQRGLEAESSHLTRMTWPRVPRAAVERHLRRLTGESASEFATALAAHAHALTAGRRSDLNTLLAQATDLGVLSREGTPLRRDWPEGLPPDAALAAEVQALPGPERTALQALAVLGTPARRTTLLALLASGGQPHPEATLHELVARGVILADAQGRLVARDPRRLEAARQSLDEAARAAWHRRCMEVLPPAARARHAAEIAGTAAEWDGVLDAADGALQAGDLATARALVQTALARGGQAGAPGRRLLLLQARLELAQGRARDALALLQKALGADLADARPDELLVAAHAAEQAGQRARVRAWLERVVAASPSRAQRLDALRGLGYAAWLEGRWQQVLDLLGDEPRPDDPDEPAAALQNLRGVTCVRLRRWDEAAACFDEARDRCARGGHALWLARTEQNRALLDRRRGRPADAVAALRRAAEAFDRAGHVAGRALALHNLGVLHRDLGDLAAARAFLQESLTLRRRTGDAHGVASTLGSLALLRLDAGQVGVALAELDAARAQLSRGNYAGEGRVLDLHRAMALALAGRHVAAAGLLAAGDPAPRAAAGHAAEEAMETPESGEGAEADLLAPLRARAAALVHACAGDVDSATRAATEALALARASNDAAEAFRAAALLRALRPADAETSNALRDSASTLPGPVRAAEAAWRDAASRDGARTDVQPAREVELESLLDTFQQAGRTDLVHAVALQLARAADAAGQAEVRRRAAARAAEATDALTDALPDEARESTLRRVMRWLAGADGARAAAGGDEGGSEPGSEARDIDVAWLLTFNRQMAAEADLQGLLQRIVDTALEVTGARRGFVVLLEDGRVSVQVARGMDRSPMPDDEVRFSLTLVKDAIAARRAVLTTDAAADSRFAGTQSIASFKLRSVLCVPLPLPGEGGAHGSLGGALYLDDDRHTAAFDATDAERVGWLADQASVAILGLRRRAELDAQRAEIEGLNRRLAVRVRDQDEELSSARTLLRRRGSVAPVAGMVGESEAMARVFTLIDRLGPTELPVLVTGPSGTGKDLVARALHARSRRADGPLVVENVAALPASLLESELFGHVRGAFTGADRDKPGLFAEAQGGTFFLDEIGDMPLELQAKLLRVLESGEMRPVGARRSVRVDVRIVAATHRDLLARAREGSFREDLYYRLNGAEIRVPPLAERLDDIPLLVEHFLARLNEKHGTARTIREPVLRTLTRRAWPGQVRELVNEVSRLYFLSDEAIDDPALVREPAAPAGGEAADVPVSLKLEDAERVALQRALAASGGRKDKAAQLLGISRAGLYAKLDRLGLAGDARD